MTGLDRQAVVGWVCVSRVALFGHWVFQDTDLRARARGHTDVALLECLQAAYPTVY
jgi:hypothetical protein